jgi:hypothetical protein
MPARLREWSKRSPLRIAMEREIGFEIDLELEADVEMDENGGHYDDDDDDDDERLIHKANPMRTLFSFLDTFFLSCISTRAEFYC